LETKRDGDTLRWRQKVMETYRWREIHMATQGDGEKERHREEERERVGQTERHTNREMETQRDGREREIWSDRERENEETVRWRDR
jgi:hypothetical protein